MHPERVTVPSKYWELKIIFRPLHISLPAWWAPDTRWQVEAYDSGLEQPPLGMAWVLDITAKRPAHPTYDVPPFIEWIRVFHGLTRCGVATALVDGARRRWPDLELSAAVSEEEAAFRSAYLARVEGQDDEGRAFARRNMHRLTPTYCLPGK